MIHLCFKRKIVVFFVGIAVLLFTTIWSSSAQEGALTIFSGRVIDEAGAPIAGCSVAVRPVVDGNGAWFVGRNGAVFPIPEQGLPMGDTQPFQAEGDAEGNFEISNTVDGPVLLSLFPSRGSAVRIVKVKIGGLSIYPSGMMERGVVFATSPGRRIENIEVIVQQPHIRGSVQRTDGTPIANADIHLRLRAVSSHGSSSGSYGGIRTDAEGYFTYYVERALEGPTFYMLSVVHQGQTVNANPIILKPGDQTHNLVFTFDNAQDPRMPARRGNFARAAASTRDTRPIASASLEDVWVIRPKNGQAYKRIRCNHWEDAQTQAAAEGAYLVTINDEAEQKWLQAVFGGQPSWIGLNDIAEEGQWVWDNGEPVTYTNWGLQEPDDTSIGDEDYVIFGPSGKWEDFGPGHGGISLIRTALIEKSTLPVQK